MANPNKLALERWASENSIKGDFDSLCEDKRAKDYLLGELNKIAKEKKVLFRPKLLQISIDLSNQLLV